MQNLSRHSLFLNSVDDELDYYYPYINWTDFFQWNLNHKYTVDEVLWLYIAVHSVVDLDYDEMDYNELEYIEKLINKTSKRTIANYIAWRFIEQNSKYSNDDFCKLHDHQLTPCIHQTRRWYVNVK